MKQDLKRLLNQTYLRSVCIVCLMTSRRVHQVHVFCFLTEHQLTLPLYTVLGEPADQKLLFVSFLANSRRDVKHIIISDQNRECGEASRAGPGKGRTS